MGLFGNFVTYLIVFNFFSCLFFIIIIPWIKGKRRKSLQISESRLVGQKWTGRALFFVGKLTGRFGAYVIEVR